MLADLPDPKEAVVSIFHHMLSPSIIHAARDFRPSEAKLLDELEQPHVLFSRPLPLLHPRVQVVVPFLPAVIEVSKISKL